MAISTKPPLTDVPGGHAPERSGARRWGRPVVAALLILSGALSFGYAGISVYFASKLVYEAQKPLTGTPAEAGLSYRNVTFPSREDHVMLRGWFIPGVLPDGRLTAQRTIIFVHGTRANRTDYTIRLLELSEGFAKRGFAVLAFDMRGMGESPPAPFSVGYFEQRDVLGAVDFLRSGTLPYPELGRPRAIAGWGISMGAATLLLAAAREPAIQAIVSDTAPTDFLAILERELPPKSGSAALTPGALVAARVLFGIDYYDVRPVDVVARLAPRPVFFIHAESDDFVPSSNLPLLVKAASSAPNAHVTSWLVPGVIIHATSYKALGDAYIDRVVTFYTNALGPDTSTAG